MIRRLLDGARAGRFDAWLVLLLSAAVYLPGLGAHDLWNPDEPRYAQVAREMLEQSSWLVPRLNGAVYAEKPPLMFWAIGAGALVRGGVDELAARAPSALAGIAMLLLVHLAGARLFGRRAAWLATLVAASTMTLAWQGHVGQIDMLLLALELGAVCAWLRTWDAPDAGGWTWPWVLCGLATLAKGPVGLIVPLLGIGAFLALQRDRAGLRRLRPLRGLALWAAIVAAWLVPAGLAGGAEYFGQIVVRQNATRFASPWGHIRPWYYYATTIPVDFLPWTPLLPAIGAGCARLSEPRARRGALFLAAWIAATVLFFSLSPGKRGVYVLPIYAALALLAGAAFDRLARDAERGDRGPSRWLLGSTVACGLLLTTIAVALPIGAARSEAVAPLGRDFPLMVAMTLTPAGVAGLVAIGLVARRRPAASIAALAAGMIVSTTLVFTTVLPRVDRVKSARPLAEVLEAHARPGEPIGIHPKLDPAFLYYAGRPMMNVATPAAVMRFAALPGRRWLLIERDDLARLPGPLRLEEVARDADLVEGYVLYTSPPWPR